ncbi:heme-binding protein [Rhizobium sp. CAU 1783]
MVVGGGLPVLFDGEVAGGIGIRSGAPARDLQFAEAGTTHFLAKRD